MRTGLGEAGVAQRIEGLIGEVLARASASADEPQGVISERWLSRRCVRARESVRAGMDNQSVTVLSRRGFLRWFHELESDDAHSATLQTWRDLSEAAVADSTAEASEIDDLAGLVIELADDDLIEFDPSKGLRPEEFGADPSRDLQHATNFRSTVKGRDWLRESAPSGPSFAFHDSTVAQVAGRDITNYVSFTQVLDAALANVEGMEADDQDRKAARRFLNALGSRAAEAGTGMVGGAGGLLAGRALAQALGVPV